MPAGFLLLFSTGVPGPWAFQVVLVVKNLPANMGDKRTRIRFLGGEDPLEESMATHSSNFAWEIPWTEEPGGLQSMGLHRIGTPLSD